MLNLSYSLFSGDKRTQEYTKIMELPQEALTVMKPFDIYYSGGKVSRIMVESEEPTWSKSIKQALAGILQLDLPNIDINKDSAFKSKEQSIQGECLVSYTVQPQENGARISKFYSGSDCESEPNIWFNFEDFGCPTINTHHYELVLSSQSVYNMIKDRNHNLIIKDIASDGKTSIIAENMSHTLSTITVSQKISLQSLNKDYKFPEVTNLQDLKSLEYDKTEFYSFKFTSNEDLENVVKKVFQLISLISSEIQKRNQIHPDSPNSQDSHLIPLLITYLRKLDINHLENIFNDLMADNSSQYKDILIELLPLVGSKETSIFIVNIICENKVRAHVALRLLNSLPFNIRQTSEKTLKELDILLNMPENVDKAVRTSAVLSFATLIFRTCKFSKCKPETIDKYVLIYVRIIKDADSDYEKKLLYMAGLQNIQSPKLMEYLEPVITGKECIGSESLQMAAMRAVFPVIAQTSDKVYEVYWPILCKSNNSLELRATALIFITKAKPSLSIFLQLHWLMANDRSTPLYIIYYMLIRSYAEEKSDCNNLRNRIARQILSMTQKPDQFLHHSRSVFTYDKFNISGEEVIISSIRNPNTDSIFADIVFSSSTTGYHIHYYSIHIKAQGVNTNLLMDIAKAIALPSEIENIFVKESADFSILKPFSIELLIYSHGKVTATTHYNQKNIGNLVQELKTFLLMRKEMKFSLHHITSSFNMETFFVTDLGMPGVFSVDHPSLSSFQIEMSPEKYSSFIDIWNSMDIRLWSQSSVVLKVKNTIVNVWQGLIKTHITHFSLPFRSQFILNDKQRLQLVFIPSGNYYAGFKWHTKTDIFTVTYNDDYDALFQSCKVCKSLTTITNKKIKNVILNEVKGDNYTLVNGVFDCEDDGTINHIKHIGNLRSGNTFLSGLGVLFSGGHFLRNYLLELPASGSCGYTSVFYPSKRHHGSKVCIELQYYDLSSAEETYNWKHVLYKNYLEVSYQNRECPDEKCCFDIINFIINDEVQMAKESLRESQDICLNDNNLEMKEIKEEWRINSKKAGFCTASPLLPHENKIIKVSVRSNQLLCDIVDAMMDFSHSTIAPVKELLEEI